MPQYKAVILVGGPSRGTRFRPLSLERPKPLFPLAGQPLLQHHVRALSKVDHLTTIYLIGFFEDSVLADFIRDASREFPHLTIRYLREYQSLGTAGGLYHFRDEILRGDLDRLFVMNADVCVPYPFEEMMKFHKDHDGWCTILGTKVQRDWARNFGCLVPDPVTNEVLHYVEKPRTFISDLVSCGVYLFDKQIFKEIGTARSTHHRRKMSLEDDLSFLGVGERTTTRVTNSTRNILEDDQLRLEQDILRMLAGNHKMFVYETKDFWRHIKTAGYIFCINFVVRLFL